MATDQATGGEKAGARAQRSTDASVDRVSDRAAATTEGVGAQAMRLRAGFLQLLDEQPLTIGALGLALGALIGAAVPATETENRWLGEATGRTREQAKC
jgi:hypothetical protein